MFAPHLDRDCRARKFDSMRRLDCKGLLHNSLKGSQTFSSRARAEPSAEFEILVGMLIICRPIRHTGSIGIAGSRELHPVGAHDPSQLLILAIALPIARKRVSQEKELFTMMSHPPGLQSCGKLLPVVRVFAMDGGLSRWYSLSHFLSFQPAWPGPLVAGPRFWA